MVVACIALFVALSGASYAAIKLPRNSVGTPQLKKNAVTSPKVKDRSLRARDFAPGQLPQGAKGATGERGPQGERGAQGPGAVKINYGAFGNPVSPGIDIATVGPWTLRARCLESGSTTTLGVFVRGPGAARWAGVKALNDSGHTWETSDSTMPDEGLYLPVGTVGADFPNFNRLAFDIQLHSSEVATVSVNGVADRRGGSPGFCSLYGTAVPAG